MKRGITTAAAAFLALALVAAGCGGARGWTQKDRDTLIGSCVKEANAGAPGLDQVKLNSYCSCYQQRLEKRFSSVLATIGVGAGELTKEAQPCLSLMLP